MALGPNDLKLIVLPANWDATYLNRVALAEGTTYAQVLADINAGLGVVNGQINAGYIGGLYNESDDPTVEYAMGSSNGFERHTEYGLPDVKRGATRGHMVPLNKYDRMLGWTWDFLKEARRVQIDADVAAAMQDALDIHEQQALTALFRMEATALGSTGFSLPFANGGVSDTAWVPPPWNGNTFAASHDHYFRTTDDAAGRLASITTMAETLWHHGHPAPFDLLIPQADLAAWTAVTGFIAAGRPEIAFGTATNLAQVGQEYIGVFNTDYGVVRVRTLSRLPTDYAGMVKVYGNGDPRASLRRRIDNNFFGGSVVLMASAEVREFPLERAMLFTAFGWGVNDRTNGAFTHYDASGDYDTPTIT